MKKTTYSLLTRVLTALVLVVCLLAFSACNSGAGDYNAGAVGGYDEGTAKPGEGVEISDSKIIKTVWQTMRTDDFDALDEKIKTQVTAVGGYISSSSYRQNGRSDLRYASLVVRVPAEKTDAFLSAVGEGHQLVSYRDKVEDVTLSYVDVTSRIAVLEAEEAALLGMLAKTETLADELAVRERLNGVQGDLASLRAQKSTYDNLVAYSTIYLELDEAAVATESMSFFGRLGLLFVDSIEGIWFGIRNFFLWLFGRSPYLLFIAGIGIGIFFLVRHLVRRHTARMLAKIEERDEKSKGE